MLEYIFLEKTQSFQEKEKINVSHTNSYYCGKSWSKTKRSNFCLSLWSISSAIISLKNKIRWNSKVRFLTNVRDPPSRKKFLGCWYLLHANKQWQIHIILYGILDAEITDITLHIYIQLHILHYFYSEKVRWVINFSSRKDFK